MMTTSDTQRMTTATAITGGSRLGKRSAPYRKIGNVSRVPTRNEATAYSSKEVVNAIRNAETIAGRINGSVTHRKVRNGPAPRSWAASSSEASICWRRGRRTRIVYGRLITTWPTPTARREGETPSTWKSSNMEIPSTTKGITSGVSSRAVTSPFARKLRRAIAMEARIPSETATTLDRAATIALASRADRMLLLWMNSWYQWSVKPLSGNEGTTALLNEKTRRIAIGA